MLLIGLLVSDLAAKVPGRAPMLLRQTCSTGSVVFFFEIADALPIFRKAPKVPLRTLRLGVKHLGLPAHNLRKHLTQNRQARKGVSQLNNLTHTHQVLPDK